MLYLACEVVIDFLVPTYKVAIGTPEFKRIWLSATFVILPFLRHSLYKIMQMNSKFQDFFLFHLLRN